MVAITYVEGAEAAWVVGAIKGSGGEAIAVQADARAPDQVKAAIDKTLAAHATNIRSAVPPCSDL
jgi:hypothetical protein